MIRDVLTAYIMLTSGMSLAVESITAYGPREKVWTINCDAYVNNNFIAEVTAFAVRLYSIPATFTAVWVDATVAARRRARKRDGKLNNGTL